MNHEHVKQNEIVDLYLMGRLGADETAAFEEHYLSCSACLEQLELAEGFRAGLKQVAADEAMRTAVVQRVGVVAWLAQSMRSPRAGLLAAAALIAVILPSTLLYRQLGEERARTDALTVDLDVMRTPQTSVMLPLSPERSGPSAEPSARVRLPSAPGWIVVSLELERPELAKYRVTLIGPDGESLWQSEELEPNAQDALTVSLHSNSLAEGDYEFRVDGLPSGGRPVDAGRFAFRALPASGS